MSKIRISIGILLLIIMTSFPLSSNIVNGIEVQANENVLNKETKFVIPGGESVGVQVDTLGLLVVGHHLVTEGNEKASPGELADIEVGDIILAINDEELTKVDDVKPIVAKAGENNKSLKLKMKRKDKIWDTTLKPIYDTITKTYQIGLYIRDSATGIGTISFYDLVSNRYGALGHVISDSDTKQPIEIEHGKIINSIVTSIEKGKKGDPGEKQAKFSIHDKQLGSITKNSAFGIFGKMDFDSVTFDPNKEAIQIALPDEVEKGFAQIMTVVENDKVEYFDIEVISKQNQKEAATKGMVIKITDKRLLDKTGGIVQGMSGSPIIQNGKLIGAVTHVFVNDPTSGYGVHIEWMLNEAGIDIYENKKIAS